MIACIWRCFAATASSTRFCSVTSRAVPVLPITSPSGPRSVTALKLSVTGVPSLRRCSVSYCWYSAPSRISAATSRSRSPISGVWKSVKARPIISSGS